jgi:helix-turn-helix protein
MRVQDAGAPPPLLKNYHSEESLAREIGVTIRTLRRWRKERQGPPITHVGRKVVYSLEGLRRWLAANEQQMPRGARRPRAASYEAGTAA